MAGIFDDFVKQGSVCIKNKKLSTWKKRWMVMRSYSSSGPARLELYNEVQGFHRLNDPSITPIQVIHLVEVIGVDTKSFRGNRGRGKVVITFASRCQRKFKFRPESYDDAEQWRRSIEQIMEPVYDDIRTWTEPTQISNSIRKTESFRVFLMASRRLPFSGECLMVVSSEEVVLRDFNHLSHSSMPFVVWEIGTIRRFGIDNEVLKIETGRSSSTGEYIFLFRSFEAEKIERHLNIVTSALSTALHLAETEILRQPYNPLQPQETVFNYDFQSAAYPFSGNIERPSASSEASFPPRDERHPCPMCSSKGGYRRFYPSGAIGEPPATSPDPNRRPSAPNPVSGRFLGVASETRRLYSVPSEVPALNSDPSSGVRKCSKPWMPADPVCGDSRAPYFDRGLPQPPMLSFPGSSGLSSSPANRRLPPVPPLDSTPANLSQSSVPIPIPRGPRFVSNRRPSMPCSLEPHLETTSGSTCDILALPPRSPLMSSSSGTRRIPQESISSTSGNTSKPVYIPRSNHHSSSSSSRSRPLPPCPASLPSMTSPVGHRTCRPPSPVSPCHQGRLSSSRSRQLTKSDRDLTHSHKLTMMPVDISISPNRSRRNPDHGNRIRKEASVRDSRSSSDSPPPIPERPPRRLNESTDTVLPRDQQHACRSETTASCSRWQQQATQPTTAYPCSRDTSRATCTDTGSDTSDDSW